LHEDVVDELEQQHVVVALVARPLLDRQRLYERELDELRWIAGHEGAERGAHDDQDFGRVPQCKDVPTFEDETPEDTTEHDDRADNLHHVDRPMTEGSERNSRPPLLPYRPGWTDLK